MLLPGDYVVWDKELSFNDKDEVGEELAGFGELLRNNIECLPRLVVTASSFIYFKEVNNINEQIKHLLGSINHDRHDSVSQISNHIRKLILKSKIPEEVYKPMYKKLEAFEDRSISLKAYYYEGKKLISAAEFNDLKGDASVVEKVREAWSDLFTVKNLASYKIHHQNHHEFRVVIAIFPVFNYTLSGHVKILSKHEYEIEAYSMVKFSFNKHSGKIEKGEVLPGGIKDALTPSEIKLLLDTAKKVEEVFYHPHTAFWEKFENNFFVTKILANSDLIDYKDTFNSLIENITVHPGVTVGKLKVIDEVKHSGVILSDEIVVLQRLDRKMIETVKRAKGIVLGEEPEPEVADVLKNAGIPTLVRKNKKPLLYSTGDVVSLNATTGEIKRGSMLVS